MRRGEAEEVDAPDVVESIMTSRAAEDEHEHRVIEGSPYRDFPWSLPFESFFILCSCPCFISRSCCCFDLAMDLM